MKKFNKNLTKKEKLIFKCSMKTNNEPNENIAKFTDDFLNKINKIYDNQQKILPIKIENSYERLAFGDINDAIKLMFLENIKSCDIEKMDLYCVSEMKRAREGSLEIKFFDKLYALGKLEELLKTQNKNSLNVFYEKIKDNLDK